MTEVTVSDLGLWDVTPCSLVLITDILNLITTSILRLYGKLQPLKMVVSDSSKNDSLALTVVSSCISFALKMETADFLDLFILL
jgi:hypothetical protein